MADTSADHTYPPGRSWPWTVADEYVEPYPKLIDGGQEIVPCHGARFGRCCGPLHRGDCAAPVEYVARWDCGEWDEECLRCEIHAAEDRKRGEWLRSLRTFIRGASGG